MVQSSSVITEKQELIQYFVGASSNLLNMAVIIIDYHSTNMLNYRQL